LLLPPVVLVAVGAAVPVVIALTCNMVLSRDLKTVISRVYPPEFLGDNSSEKYPKAAGEAALKVFSDNLLH